MPSYPSQETTKSAIYPRMQYARLLRRQETRLLYILPLFSLGIFLFIHQSFRTKNELLKSTNDELISTTMAPSLEEKLKSFLRCKDKELNFERLQYGGYWLVRNIVIGDKSRNMGCSESITYTTNGDYTFFGNLANLVNRWLAPISFAIFAPGYDLNATMESIQYVRNCLPESELIRQYVTFHVFFPTDHMPPKLPLNETEALNWPYAGCDNESVVGAPYHNVDRHEMYKTVHNLTYPINVARNIARKSANTYFIFACDIELYPSPGFVPKFLEMVDRNHSVIGDDSKPRVFPLPVFELHSNATLPNTKDELLHMLKIKMAIPFHSKICVNCHLMPNQTQWLNLTTDTNEMSVFAVGKREYKFIYWEPFYISDNKEPIFDERVTWEGQKNKRIQAFAMCLLNYEFHLLNMGFLVHSPGIKYFEKNSTRLKYVPPMNKLIKNVIAPEYRILYGKNKKCGV